MVVKKNRLFLLLLLLCSCDFSSGLHKDILLAQEHLEQQNYEEAIKLYKSILKRHPNQSVKIKVYYQLGELYSIYLNGPTEAEKWYLAIAEQYEDPLWLVRSYHKLGDLYFSGIKDFFKASKIYKKLYEFYPVLKDQDFYHQRLALSYLNANQLNKAMEVFQQINVNTQHEFYRRSFYFMGKIHFQEKNWDLAIKQWLEYLKRETRRNYVIETKFLIANAYETNEKLKEAYDLYYTLLGEYPNSEIIKKRLESLYARRVARNR